MRGEDMNTAVANYEERGIREYAKLLHQCISDFGRVRMIAFGNSMKPTISNRDILIIESCKFDFLKVNDIVFFVQANYNIHKIHRIIHKYQDFLIAKGDNCVQEDIPVRPNEIVGLVVKTYSAGTKT